MTSTPTNTSTSTATVTDTPTKTLTSTATPTTTSSATATNSPTSTATTTATWTSTSTATATALLTATATLTSTPGTTATATPLSGNVTITAVECPDGSGGTRVYLNAGTPPAGCTPATGGYVIRDSEGNETTVTLVNGAVTAPLAPGRYTVTSPSGVSYNFAINSGQNLGIQFRSGPEPTPTPANGTLVIRLLECSSGVAGTTFVVVSGTPPAGCAPAQGTFSIANALGPVTTATSGASTQLPAGIYIVVAPDGTQFQVAVNSGQQVILEARVGPDGAPTATPGAPVGQALVSAFYCPTPASSYQLNPPSDQGDCIPASNTTFKVEQVSQPLPAVANIAETTPPPSITTDGNGNFGPFTLPVGTWLLTGPTGLSFMVTINPDQVVELRYIRAGAKVSLAAFDCGVQDDPDAAFLLNPNGNPACQAAGGAIVEVRDKQGNLIATIHVGPDGTFSAVLPPGDYTFVNPAIGASFDVTANEGDDIELLVLNAEPATPTPGPSATATPVRTPAPTITPGPYGFVSIRAFACPGSDTVLAVAPGQAVPASCQPIAGRDFIVRDAGGNEWYGRTDSNGNLMIQVPSGTMTVIDRGTGTAIRVVVNPGEYVSVRLLTGTVEAVPNTGSASAGPLETAWARMLALVLVALATVLGAALNFRRRDLLRLRQG